MLMMMTITTMVSYHTSFAVQVATPARAASVEAKEKVTKEEPGKSGERRWDPLLRYLWFLSSLTGACGRYMI